jgi:hypothetical protein
MFIGGGGFRIRWDPAVLQTNDAEDATCGIGSGALTFWSGAGCAGGTLYQTVSDEDLGDQITIQETTIPIG